MANKPGEANFFPDVPQFPSMGTFQPVYGKFDLTTYIQGASDYEIMAFLVGKYNACLEAYGNITKLSTDTITACKQLQDWINSWFTNLDVQEELNNKIDSMVQDGSFGTLLHQTFDAQINEQTASAVTRWLVANVTPAGSAVVVDKSLSIEGAAADAKATGAISPTMPFYISNIPNLTIEHNTENNTLTTTISASSNSIIITGNGVSYFIGSASKTDNLTGDGKIYISLYYDYQNDRWAISQDITIHANSILLAQLAYYHGTKTLGTIYRIDETPIAYACWPNFAEGDGYCELSINNETKQLNINSNFNHFHICNGYQLSEINYHASTNFDLSNLTPGKIFYTCAELLPNYGWYVQPYKTIPAAPNVIMLGEYVLNKNNDIYSLIEFFNIRKLLQPITEENHWNNKKWYAYGTSITNISSEGRYPTYLAQLSGMNLTNKGISGGGIVNNTKIKDAIMNTSDGKLTADLITIEIGANDGTAILGDIYDTNDDTFCGALNQCIRYLQQNVPKAQIVVWHSPTTIQWAPNSETYTPPEYQFGTDNHTQYDQAEAVRKVCAINNVKYIDMFESCGMGYYRQYYNRNLTQDGVHPSDVGGKNIAEYIWGQLKNVPLWYTSV